MRANRLVRLMLLVIAVSLVVGVVQAQEEERELRVSFSWPLFIDPAVGSDFAGSTALLNLYDTLVFPDANNDIIPWVAESWEVSDDGLVWTFHLRDDVVFHDGTELLASDVVYSLNRLKTIGEGFYYLFENVSDVQALDDHTVQFTLAQPSGVFLPSLVRLFIVNEDLVRANTAAEGPYGENGDFGKDFLLLNDAGSGPYQVREFQLESFIVMDKFDDWWGEFAENAPDVVRFIGTTQTATIRTLMADGELDITDQWQTVEALEALDAMDGVEIAALPTMTSFYYMMNTRLAPLDDIHCRRAVAYAFDYDTAVSLEWPGTTQMIGPVPASLGGHNPNVLNYERDLDKAREELAQCQYAADIANYPIEIHWIAEVPDEEKFALLFQANLAEIGMPVEVIQSPWLSVVENSSRQETSPHIVTIYVSADLPEAGLMLRQRYHSSTTGTWQQNEWLLDEELDQRLEDALATIDQEERFAKYRELQSYVAELTPSLFIYDQIQKHAYRDYVDWPAARGETSAIMGYQFFLPEIAVNN